MLPTNTRLSTPKRTMATCSQPFSNALDSHALSHKASQILRTRFSKRGHAAAETGPNGRKAPETTLSEGTGLHSSQLIVPSRAGALRQPCSIDRATGLRTDSTSGATATGGEGTPRATRSERATRYRVLAFHGSYSFQQRRHAAIEQTIVVGIARTVV